MKLNITNNDLFGIVETLVTIQSSSFKFNRELRRVNLCLQKEIIIVQELIKGLNEEAISKIGMEMVEVEFTALSEELIPDELDMSQTNVVCMLMEP